MGFISLSDLGGQCKCKPESALKAAVRTNPEEDIFVEELDILGSGKDD